MKTIECDNCGKEFERYQSQIDESETNCCSRECADELKRNKEYPNRVERIEVECDNCGETVRRLPSNAGSERQFCDQDCHAEWQAENYQGEGHPSWNRKSVECAQCGEKLLRPESELDKSRHFCDNSCRGEWQSENYNRSDNPNWQRITVECDYCGSELKRPPYKEKQENHFCDRECQGNYQSENWTGEASPRWESKETECVNCGAGLLRAPYKFNQKGQFCDLTCFHERQSYTQTDSVNDPDNRGRFWKQQRKKALRRDEFKCQECGISQSEHEKNHGMSLHVHHIKPSREFESKYNAHSIENLVCLCISCHPENEVEDEIDQSADQQQLTISEVAE